MLCCNYGLVLSTTSILFLVLTSLSLGHVGLYYHWGSSCPLSCGASPWCSMLVIRIFVVSSPCSIFVRWLSTPISLWAYLIFLGSVVSNLHLRMSGSLVYHCHAFSIYSISLNLKLMISIELAWRKSALNLLPLLIDFLFLLHFWTVRLSTFLSIGRARCFFIINKYFWLIVYQFTTSFVQLFPSGWVSPFVLMHQYCLVPSFLFSAIHVVYQPYSCTN